MRFTLRTLTFALLFASCLPALAQTPPTIDDARERFQACQLLLDDDQPCEALRACKQGLEVLDDNEALERLTRDAEKRCRRARAPRDNAPSNDVAGPELTPVDEPEPDVDGDGLPDRRDPCPAHAEDGHGDAPDDGCPDPDRDGDGVANASDACPDRAEDVDGFEDDDGCPELDNDRDGVVDLLDLCANSAEDQDGFEDEDGCPELDNDRDGIADAHDACPNQPEDVDGVEDTDGCRDVDTDIGAAPLALMISGGGLLFTGAILETFALVERNAVLSPPTEDGLVVDHTQSAAKARLERSDTLQNAAWPLLGLGTAALTAGIILLFLPDDTEDTRAFELHFTPSLRGASLELQMRF